MADFEEPPDFDSDHGGMRRSGWRGQARNLRLLAVGNKKYDGSIIRIESDLNFYKKYAKPTKEVPHAKLTKELDLPLPRDGIAYTRSEAIRIAIDQTARGTSRRRELVSRMANMQYISSESVFYDMLGKIENGETIADGPWKRKGRPSKDTPLFKLALPPAPPATASKWNNRVTEFVLTGSWRGQLDMKYAAISHEDLSSYANYGEVLTESGDYSTGHYSLKEKIVDISSEGDICAWLGQWEFAKQSDVCRLYLTVGAPVVGSDVTECPIFQDLLECIKLKAAQCGSPVVCCGNSTGVEEKIFRCQRCYRGDQKRKIQADSDKGRNGTCCPFSFTLRWDRVGYYIHLSEFSYDAPPGEGNFEFKGNIRWRIGWPHHNCAPVVDDMDSKEGGRYELVQVPNLYDEPRKLNVWQCNFCTEKFDNFEKLMLHERRCNKRLQK